MKKNVITVTGIRPDFIRMSEIFHQLDATAEFRHIMVHSGQHYSENLSDVFFKEFGLRTPDVNLEIGHSGHAHYHQLSDLNIKLMAYLRMAKLSPEESTVILLGDSNTVLVAPTLRKEGYRIAHIEAGMRSYDKRMLEETNRVVCDHCSDLLFVYHDDYAKNCLREGIRDAGIFVVGNTIVEVMRKYWHTQGVKSNSYIGIDIHRPENFMFRHRLVNILEYTHFLADEFDLRVRFLAFPRTLEWIRNHGIDIHKHCPYFHEYPLMSYHKFLEFQHDAFCMVSDSGTAQEEAPLLYTPVIVPRDYTERPQSVQAKCSFMLDVNSQKNKTWDKSVEYLTAHHESQVIPDISWLGDGQTSKRIVDILRNTIA